MIAICTCRNAKIKETSSGEKYCAICGYYWIEKYGSKIPDITAPSRLIGCNDRRKDPPKIRRNDPCPCGSGLKFKSCCIWQKKI